MHNTNIHNDWVHRLIRADFNPILSDSGFLWFSHGDVICSLYDALNLIRSPSNYDLIPANHDWLVANGDKLLAAITAARLRQ